MIKKIRDFFEGVQFEFKKITWPSFEELRSSIWVVLGMTALLSVILFVMDKIMSALVLNLIMGR
jgi:preprotein translocase SecE subunit